MAEELEIVEPKPAVKRKRGGVSCQKLDKAAAELNLIRVNAAGLTNIATVGRFLDQVGMLNYGNGRLLSSAAMIADSAERCGQLAQNEQLDHQIRQGYLKLQLAFIEALDKNVELHLNLTNAPVNESVRGNAPPPMPSKPFLPGANISPIQINISAGAATVTEQKEPPCKTSSS